VTSARSRGDSVPAEFSASWCWSGCSILYRITNAKIDLKGF
jgi:hypothetical protein